ncbi:MAG: flagellar type III secretion system pore protein FliP [Gammaproteobacteria bacterium]|nr:flagellar type III secretion system pore protein FliP [Gammaproteobacteria bacterium]MDH5800660.1 flagellar type III secretion system pore protein FliP [Gammaproteobacteria bacterium]
MKPGLLFIVFIVCVLFADVSSAADIQLPGVDITIGDSSGDKQDVATAIKVLVGLTVLSLVPALLIVMTSFTRIIIVLSILRHAFGMQQTPPNTVLISLALFLTVFTMAPVFSSMNQNAFQPYLNNQITSNQALQVGMQPIREFMIRQTREKDLALMLELSKQEAPASVDDVSSFTLLPAFMISELKTAFEIGFIIFLPFLLIDIVVASILMSMGMLMVPPMMISMPIKIMMFVLIDGWSLVVNSLVSSFA